MRSRQSNSFPVAGEYEATQMYMQLASRPTQACRGCAQGHSDEERVTWRVSEIARELAPMKRSSMRGAEEVERNQENEVEDSWRQARVLCQRGTVVHLLHGDVHRSRRAGRWPGRSDDRPIPCRRRRLLASLRLAGDKAKPCPDPGSGRLDRRVQGEQIGLGGDVFRWCRRSRRSAGLERWSPGSSPPKSRPRLRSTSSAQTLANGVDRARRGHASTVAATTFPSSTGDLDGFGDVAAASDRLSAALAWSRAPLAMTSRIRRCADAGLALVMARLRWWPPLHLRDVLAIWLVAGGGLGGAAMTSLTSMSF